MSPSERDILIATVVMGITELNCNGPLRLIGTEGLLHHRKYACMVCSVVLTVTRDYLEGRGVPTSHVRHIPDYSTSLDAAQELFKQWPHTTLEVEYQTEHQMYMTKAVITTNENTYQAYNYNMTEALCVASLRAKGYEVNV